MAIMGSMWLLRGLYGYYRVYVAIIGSMWLLLLWGLRGYYGVYVVITGSTGYYGVYMAVMGSMWLLRGLCGCYGVYVTITGLYGYYRICLLRVYVVVTGTLPHTHRNCHKIPVSHSISGKSPYMEFTGEPYVKV